jgi:hypothetical protein
VFVKAILDMGCFLSSDSIQVVKEKALLDEGGPGVRIELHSGSDANVSHVKVGVNLRRKAQNWEMRERKRKLGSSRTGRIQTSDAPDHV